MDGAPAPALHSRIDAERRRLDSALTRAFVAMLIVAGLCVLTAFVSTFLGAGGGAYGFLAVLAAMIAQLAYLQRAAVRLSRMQADAAQIEAAGRGSPPEAWTHD